MFLHISDLLFTALHLFITVITAYVYIFIYVYKCVHTHLFIHIYIYMYYYVLYDIIMNYNTYTIICYTLVYVGDVVYDLVNLHVFRGGHCIEVLHVA